MDIKIFFTTIPGPWIMPPGETFFNMRFDFHPLRAREDLRAGSSPVFSIRKALCLFLCILVPFGGRALPAYADQPAAAGNGNGEADSTPDTGKKTDEKIPGQNGNYPKVVIGPGDELEIQVYDETLASNYQVDSEGLIEFPYAGRVNLAGLTPVEASEKLDHLMDKPRSVTVRISKSNTFWISVLGDVKGAGKFEIRGENTLASVLAEVGGPEPDANLDRALLVHGQKKTFVPLRNLLRNEGDTGPPIYIYPGDTLMVYRADFPATIGDITQVIGLVLGGVTLYLVAKELSK
jgi:hypothetical protein